MNTQLGKLGLAMNRVDHEEVEGDSLIEAVGRALIETPHEDDAALKREREEEERHGREDAIAADAMDVMERARQRNGRRKWTQTDGRIFNRICAALRDLPIGESL